MSHIALKHPMTAPQSLKRMTQFRGPNIEQINDTAQAKLEVAGEDQVAVNELLEQKIAQNGALIKAIDEENKQMMLTLRNVTARKAVTPYFQQQTGFVNNAKAQQMMNREMNDTNQQYNIVLNERKKTETKLNKLEDELKLTLNAIDRPEPIVERALGKVRELENKLDDASIRKKEALSIQDTYNTIVNRLKMESLRFEKEIEFAALQTDLQVRDQNELDQYLREAIEAAATVNFEHQQLEATVQEMRGSWQGAIKGRRELVEEIVEREKRLEKERLEAKIGFVGDQEGQFSTSDSDFGDIDGRANATQANLSFFQAKFAGLRGLFGIEDLHQFAARLIGQLEARVDLQEQEVFALQQLKDVSGRLSQTRAKLTDVTFSVESNASRSQLDKIGHQIAELRHKSLALQQQYNREEGKYGQILRGIQHIFSQVAMFRTDVPCDRFVDESLAPRQKIDLIKQKVQILTSFSGSNPLDLVMSATQPLLRPREADAVDFDADDWLVQDPTWAKILNPNRGAAPEIDAALVETDFPAVKKIDDDFDAARLAAKRQSRRVADAHAKREDEY